MRNWFDTCGLFVIEMEIYLRTYQKKFELSIYWDIAKGKYHWFYVSISRLEL